MCRCCLPRLSKRLCGLSLSRYRLSHSLTGICLPHHSLSLRHLSLRHISLRCCPGLNVPTGSRPGHKILHQLLEKIHGAAFASHNRLRHPLRLQGQQQLLYVLGQFRKTLIIQQFKGRLGEQDRFKGRIIFTADHIFQICQQRLHGITDLKAHALIHHFPHLRKHSGKGAELVHGKPLAFQTAAQPLPQRFFQGKGLFHDVLYKFLQISRHLVHSFRLIAGNSGKYACHIINGVLDCDIGFGAKGRRGTAAITAPPYALSCSRRLRAVNGANPHIH